MNALEKFFQGNGLIARAARSSAWTLFGYGTSQALRLASNLILARLLFPEAFGLMALVSVFMVGLAMFSDFGIGLAVMQNKRGDDPHFLNTAWTIQVVRGFVLWVATCLLAWPAASFYDAPILMQLIPVAGLALVISGFNPTRIEQANRHLALGRVTILDIASQLVGVVSTVALAWWTQSVWSLVLGGLVAAAAKLALMHFFLPGTTNRFRWEARAGHDLLHFGKWIFISTVSGFFIAQGDKAILGKYLTLDMLGIYNIGQLIASFPLLLGGGVVSRVFIPLYREVAVDSSLSLQKIRLIRFSLTGGIFALQLLLAVFGIALIGLLYDPRFALAGPVVVVIACIQMVQFLSISYDFSAIAAGDTRGFFYLTAIKAVALTLGILVGVNVGGLGGAIMGQGLAMVLVYPLVVRLARRHSAWDPLHDLVFGALLAVAVPFALWINWDAVVTLSAFGS